MSREEIQKLLGGYATDTLSEAERRALYEAALDDQELFDALAREQALRDVLQDPSARHQLLEALAPVPEAFPQRAWRWLGLSASPALAGALATVLVVAGIVMWQTRRHDRAEAIVAENLATRGTPAPARPDANPQQQPARGRLFEPPAPRPGKQSAPLASPPALPKRNEIALADRPAVVPAPPLAPSLQATAIGGVAGGRTEAKEQVELAAAAPVAQPVTAEDTKPRFEARDGARLAAAPRAMAPAGNLMKAAPGPRSAGYTMLLKDAAGNYSAMPPGATLHAGDSVRIQVTPSQSGWVYLFQADSAGSWRQAATQQVEQARQYVLPAVGGIESTVAARVELLLVLSRTRQPGLTDPSKVALDALASNAAQASPAVASPGNQNIPLTAKRPSATAEPASFRISLDYR